MGQQRRARPIDGLFRKVKPANFAVPQKSQLRPSSQSLPPAPPAAQHQLLTSVPPPKINPPTQKESIQIKPPAKLSLPPVPKAPAKPKEPRFFPDQDFFEISLQEEYENDAREKNAIVKRIVFSLATLIIFTFLGISGIFLLRNSQALSEKVYAESMSGKNYLLSAQDSFLAFDFSGAETNFQKAYADFEKIDERLKKLGQANILIGNISGPDSVVTSAEKLIAVAKDVSSAGKEMATCAGLFDQFSLLDQKQIDSWYPFEAAQQRLKHAKISLEDAQENLLYINPKSLPQVDDLISSLKDKLPIFRKFLTLLINVSLEAPELLGKDKTQKYLILFQNPAEARATGGFLGNYGYLEFTQGKMLGPKVEDIYKLAWLTRGKSDIIKPPEEIFEAKIGLWQKSRWEIWDANWAIDFPQTAQKMEWYYESYDQGLTDGVIALDPIVFSDILKIIGPIKMKKYRLTIDSQNFWQVMERKVELDNPFKKGKASYGEANPKQILKDFSVLFMEKIKSQSKEKKIEIIKSIYENLKRKHLLLFANNAALSDVLANLNWNGQVIQTNNKNEGYLYVNESNVGVNKSSSRIKQSFDLETDVSENKIQNHLKIIRRHTGSKNKPIEGRNISYLRILVPKGSTLNSILVDGQDVAPRVILGEESEKTKFGLLTSLEPQNTQVIELTYTLPFIIEPTSITPKYYSLYFQKQPGKISDNINLKVNIDPIFKIKAIDSKFGGNFSGNMIEFISDHLEDREFKILLSK